MHFHRHFRGSFLVHPPGQETVLRFGHHLENLALHKRRRHIEFIVLVPQQFVNDEFAEICADAGLVFHLQVFPDLFPQIRQLFISLEVFYKFFIDFR